MRVVTFNIRNGAAADGEYAWPRRREPFLQSLRGLNADILCLQEVLHFQLGEIVAALNGYEWVGAGRDDGIRAGEFVPIFYRDSELEASKTFWLSETPNIPGSIAWGARLPRICTVAIFEEFTVANVHLDHESKQARSNGVKLMLDICPAADIVCGDFNAEPDEACIRAMESAGYVDLGRHGGGTFNDFQPDPPTPPRIDYIFTRNSRRGDAVVVREPLVSDHWPLLAVIETRM